MKNNQFVKVKSVSAIAIFGATLPNGKVALKTCKGKIVIKDVFDVEVIDKSNEEILATLDGKGINPQFWTQAEIENVIAENPASVETLPASPAAEIEVVKVVETLPSVPRSPRLVAPSAPEKLPTFAEISKRFAVVHQKSASEDFAFLAWEAIQGKNPIQPKHISGYAGLGKTHFVENVLFPFLEMFNFHLVVVPIGCTAPQLIKLLIDAAGKKALFWIDEVHAVKCANLLKAITETGGKVKDFDLPLGNETFTVTVDPRQWIFISASNHALKDSALVGQSGRFQPAMFTPYDEKARKSLLSTLGKQYGLGAEESASITLLAKNVRPFARSIKNLVNDIRMETVISGADVNDTESLKSALVARSYFPGGWKQHHIEVLRFVNGSPKGRQVQEIAASPLQGRDSKEASEILAEMLQGDLIQTNSQGRKQISAQGVIYLNKIKAVK